MKHYICIYPYHINTMLPYCHLVMLHLDLWPVVCIELITEINTLHFVIVIINHFRNFTIGNCIVPKNKQKKLLVVLVLTWPPHPLLDHLFSWMDCWQHCDNIIVHPTENTEAVIVTVVIGDREYYICYHWLQQLALVASLSLPRQSQHIQCQHLTILSHPQPLAK